MEYGASYSETSKLCILTVVRQNNVNPPEHCITFSAGGAVLHSVDTVLKLQYNQHCCVLL